MTTGGESGIQKGSIRSQLRALSRTYWIANWMELVERFAYYGVRVVLPVYLVLAIADGGPQFTHVQKGSIYAIWALVQSFLPIFSGGFADRYGFKINISIATVLKIIGYMVMGFCIPIAELIAGQPLAEARAAGIDQTYTIFFTGAMFLAAGTAIFKPGVQGLIASEMPEESASLGWGVFYQMVNIGGFVGPMLAGYLRVLDWTYVFMLCAAAIALNFIPLFFFKDPERTAEQKEASPLELVRQAVAGLLEPRLFFFTIAFAGFWLMFYQLFDILPNFIDDWVDSRGPANALKSVFGAGAVPTVNGGNLTQEWMLNFNGLTISLLAFSVGFISGRVRALSAIIVGIGVSAIAIYGLGMAVAGWWTLAMIGLFSLGEMSASPTKLRYLADIAPPGKQGLYMGYANMTVGIGWSLGSIVAGELYQQSGDKIVLARRYLIEQLGQPAAEIMSVPREKVLPLLQDAANVDSWGARDLLWNTYNPSGMWVIFTLIGIGSLVCIFLYDRLTQHAKANPDHSFNTKGHLWVRGALIPIVSALAIASFWKPSLALIIQTVMFAMLLVASFLPQVFGERS